jgi:protein phosphatase
VSDTVVWTLILAVGLFGIFLWFRGQRAAGDGPGPQSRSRTPRSSGARPADGAGAPSRRPPLPASRSGRPLASSPPPPASSPSSSRPPSSGGLPRVPLAYDEDEEDVDITKLTIATIDEEPDEGPTEHHVRAFVPIVFEDEAVVDEPTNASPYILVSAAGQTDRGLKRKRNEDSYLVIDAPPVFAVADGMGGYAGGDVASAMAVEEIEHAFSTEAFDEHAHVALPRRASELVQVIQRANMRIYEVQRHDRDLRGMGTTLVCARFSPNKQRVYVGHVGDSRCYVLRGRELRQITSDHIAAAHGVQGKMGLELTRALGIGERVLVDILIGKPRPGDYYLLCSDGLSKMLSDREIRDVIVEQREPQIAVKSMIDAANERGGKDNVTVILVRVDPARPVR